MQIAIPVFPELTALDAVGPYQVFSYLPGADVVLCADRPGVVIDDQGLLRLDVVHALDDVRSPDVVVVPGGQVVHRMCRDGDPVIEWLRRVEPGATVVASVCTGALLLGAAGLLDGAPATTHWSAYAELAGFGATPSEDRIVEHGRIVTAAGVSAGIDLALAVVGGLAGDDTARAIQLGIEYDPQPPYDAGATSKAPPAIVDLVQGMLDDQRDAVLARPADPARSVG